MVTMVDRMLELADQLISDRPRSAAFLRRAVSTAYYAVYHQIMKICSEQIASEHRRLSAEYLRVYRSLDHADIKKKLNEHDLKIHERFKTIGESFAILLSERYKADYEPPAQTAFPVSRVQELIAEARKTTRRLEDLSSADRQKLVIHLLIKARDR